MTSSQARRPQIVFLVEGTTDKIVIESLMQNLMKGLLTRISVVCIPHQGKTSLKKSIPRKLGSWENPDARFIIVHDQDGNDCYRLKEELRDACGGVARPGVFIRIACKSLEAWYWGDLEAVAKAYSKFQPGRVKNKALYRVPDDIVNPYGELKKVLLSCCGDDVEAEKMQMARKIAPHLRVDGKNESQSFQAFFKSVEATIANLQQPGG